MTDRLDYQAPGHIAVVNRSSTIGDGEVLLWLAAAAEAVKPLADAWSLAPPGFALYSQGHEEEPDPSVAAIYIVNTAGDPDALGYHTAAGRSRFGYVDATLAQAFDIPSVVFFHEVFELFVDADCNRWMGVPAGGHVPIEVCDPVQRDDYSLAVTSPLAGSGRVRIANWVFPSWFDSGATNARFDYAGTIFRPFSVSSGGYYLVEQDGVVTSRGMVRLKNFGRTFRRLTQGRQENGRPQE